MLQMCDFDTGISFLDGIRIFPSGSDEFLPLGRKFIQITDSDIKLDQTIPRCFSDDSIFGEVKNTLE